MSINTYASELARSDHAGRKRDRIRCKLVQKLEPDVEEGIGLLQFVGDTRQLRYRRADTSNSLGRAGGDTGRGLSDAAEGPQNGGPGCLDLRLGRL